MPDANERTDSDAEVQTPRAPRVRTVWSIGYIKRKLQERKAKNEKEAAPDRAARRVATATWWLAFFTLILMMVGIGTCAILKNQLREMHEGGGDTKALAKAAGEQAVAAGKQADAARTQSEQAITQTNKMAESLKKTDQLIKEATVQALATNRLADAAGRSADLAEKSLDGAREASHLDERAWVTVHGFVLPPVIGELIVIGKVPTVSMFVENSGRTPAVDVSVAGTIIIRQTLSKEDLADTTVGERTSNMIIGPKTPPASVPLDCDRPVPTQHVIDGVIEGITRVYAIGAIYYNDIFKQPHKTRFCFSVGAKDYGKMAACKEHNTIE